MQIKRFSLGQLQTNCYIICKGSNCILVDPADDASFLLEELSRQNLNLIAMFATHGHFDHVLAVGEIQLSLKVPLYIHARDLFLIKRLKETASHFLIENQHITPPSIIKFVPSGSFRLDGFKLKIIETPGHTPGGCCFYFRDERILFTGDTLFKGTVGRTDLSYSSRQDLEDSLKKLFVLPVGTTVYPGHGEETIIGQEEPLYHF